MRKVIVYCDRCGCETKKHKGIKIVFDPGFTFETSYKVEVCEDCINILKEKLKRNIEAD